LKFDFTTNKANDDSSVSDILDLFGYPSKKETKNKRGIDRIWELCESTVAYHKFLLPPDFNEDEEAILNEVEVDDFTSKAEETNNTNTNT
jgi:hypothetical protein